MTALTVALLAAACSSSGDSSPPSSTAAAPSSSNATAAATAASTSAVVPCSSFDGTPTVDVEEFFDQGNSCGVDRGLAELEPAPLGIKDLECLDGTYLYWNDAGWGPAPGTWTTSSRRTPPRDILTSCRGE